MDRKKRNSLIFIASVIGFTLFILVCFMFSNCAQVGPHLADPSVYRSSRDSINEANKAKGEIYKYQRYRASENIADSENYITQKNIEKVYLDQMKTAAIAKVAGATDISALQQSLNSIQKSWLYGYGQIGQQGVIGGSMVAGRPARLVPLRVINSSKNYIVQFTEEPLRTLVGQLGPGQESRQRVLLPEGRYTLKYLEIQAGRDYSYGRERRFDLFINKDITSTIKIY